MLALFLSSPASPSHKFTCALVVFILYGAAQEQHQSQSRSQKQEQSILISCILILFGDKSAALPMLFVWSRIYVCIVCTYIKIFATFGLSHFHGSCSHKNREEKTNKNKAADSEESRESGIRLQCDLVSSSCWFWAKMLSLELGVAPGSRPIGHMWPNTSPSWPSLSWHSHTTHDAWSSASQRTAVEEQQKELERRRLWVCCLGRDRNYKFHNGKAG